MALLPLKTITELGNVIDTGELACPVIDSWADACAFPTKSPPVPVFVLAEATEGSRVTEIGPEVEGTILPRFMWRFTVMDNPVIIVALTFTVWEAWE